MPKSYLESLLSEREKVLLITRQHWFLLASAIFVECVAILIIFAAAVAAAVAFPPFIILIVAVGFLLLMLPLGTMTRDILVWTNRQYLVTNRRVMQIAGIFNKNVTDSSLEKVNDVKMSQSVLGRMFNYGDIEILTASELGVNLFRQIENPIGFKTAMLNAKEELERGEEAYRIPSVGAPIDPAVLLTQLAQLRQQGIITEEEFQRKKAELLSKM
ncbi:MAG TPA: PH domain-containing protein [Anaerolineales bacterium]|nr:PH domain-containing protein [Anaerolineales bacterium]